MLGALIGIGILSLIAGVASTYYTNLQTSKLADQANGLQYEQFLQSQDFNRNERIAAEQYNTQERLEAQQFNVGMMRESQLYNSPAAQAQRLRDAGINPASVIGGDGNMSPVQSSPASVSGASSPGIPGQIVPSMENLFQPQMSTGLLDSVMSALDKREDIIGKNTDNQSRAVRNKAEIDKMIAEKESILASKCLTKAQEKKTWQELEVLRVQKSIQDNELTMSKVRADSIDKTIKMEFDRFQLERDKFEFDKAATRFTAELQERGMQLQEAQTHAAIVKTMQEVRSMQVNDKFVSAQTVVKVLERNGVVLDNSRKSIENAMLQNDKISSDVESQHQQAYQKTVKNGPLLYRLADQVLWQVSNTGAGIFKGFKFK